MPCSSVGVLPSRRDIALGMCARHRLVVPAHCLQGLASLSAGSQGHGVAFLQRRVQDGTAKVTVAGVGEPGKSVDKRVGRLAQKWFANLLLSMSLLRCVRVRVTCLPAPSDGTSLQVCLK